MIGFLLPPVSTGVIDIVYFLLLQNFLLQSSRLISAVSSTLSWWCLWVFLRFCGSKNTDLLPQCDLWDFGYLIVTQRLGLAFCAANCGFLSWYRNDLICLIKGVIAQSPLPPRRAFFKYAFQACSKSIYRIYSKCNSNGFIVRKTDSANNINRREIKNDLTSWKEDIWKHSLLWKVKSLRKCLKQTLFLMTSRGQVLWL